MSEPRSSSANTVLIIGAVLLILAVAVPPWRYPARSYKGDVYAGHAFMMNPPSYPVDYGTKRVIERADRIDSTILAFELVAIFGATALAYVALRGGSRSVDDA